MNRWAVQDAKARFSELLRAAREEGPQLITSRKEEAAVVVPIAEWLRLSATAARRDPLLETEPRFDWDIAPRMRDFSWRDEEDGDDA